MAASPAAVPVPSQGCEAVLVLTAAERRLLQALPEQGRLIDAQLWCDLEAGHPGEHVALGQLSGDDWWWLRWDEPAGRRELVWRPVCARRAGVGEPGEPDVPCALPEGHPGSHSYTRPA